MLSAKVRRVVLPVVAALAAGLLSGCVNEPETPPIGAGCPMVKASLSDSWAKPGSTLKITGKGSSCLSAGPDHHLTLKAVKPDGFSPLDLGIATPGSDGGFTASVTLPESLPKGQYIITISGGVDTCNDTVAGALNLASCAYDGLLVNVH